MRSRRRLSRRKGKEWKNGEKDREGRRCGGRKKRIDHGYWTTTTDHRQYFMYSSDSFSLLFPSSWVSSSIPLPSVPWNFSIE